MADYPDWTRLFHLVGTEITIPISIEASDVTIPVSIDAATATVNVKLTGSIILDVDIIAQTVGNLNVNLAASAITLNMNLASSDITLNVNLQTQTANIDISFEDQSVAVFDAAKWFAHEADQWSVRATGSVSASSNLAASRTVPTGKVGFLLGCGWALHATAFTGPSIPAAVLINGVLAAELGSNRGGATIFDVPFRATAGQSIEVYVYNYDGSARSMRVSMWGYDEEE